MVHRSSTGYWPSCFLTPPFSMGLRRWTRRTSWAATVLVSFTTRCSDSSRPRGHRGRCRRRQEGPFTRPGGRSEPSQARGWTSQTHRKEAPGRHWTCRPLAFLPSGHRPPGSRHSAMPAPQRRHRPGTLTTTSDGPAQADEADIQTAYLTREVLWLVQSNPYYEHTRATPSARRDLDRAFVCDCDYLDLSCTLFGGDCQSVCSRQKISRHVVWKVHR